MRSAKFLISRIVLSSTLLAASLSAAETPSPALLVLLRDDSAVVFVDPSSEKVVARLPTGDHPHEITVSTDGSLAFASSPTDGTITVIAIAAQKEVRRVPFGKRSRVHGVRYAGGRVYFTSEGYQLIGSYDPAKDEVDWMLGTDQKGSHLTILSKDLTKIFVPNGDSDTISVIENISAKRPTQWNVSFISTGKGSNPEGFDLSQDEKELWVMGRSNGIVSVIDVPTKKIVYTLDLHTKDANRLHITLDSKLVLITDGPGGEMTVIDKASRKEIKRVKTTASQILFPPDGTRAYLAADEDVEIFDLKTLEVTGHISVGAAPSNMAWLESK